MIHHAEGAETVTVNQRAEPPIDHLWFRLGAFRFEAGRRYSVDVDASKADGAVHLDAVQVLPLP